MGLNLNFIDNYERGRMLIAKDPRIVFVPKASLNLLNVNLWSPVNITATDLLDIYVHTQQIRFKGSKSCLKILRLQIDLNADVPIILKLIFDTSPTYP
jgi:hypothetical protein